MVLLKITEDARTQARYLEKKTIESLTSKGMDTNYTSIYAMDRYFWGYLGEILFTNYLKEKGKRYIWQPNTDGSSHDTDIIVFIKGNMARLDTKVARRSHFQYCGRPDIQVERQCPDFYIGLRNQESGFLSLWGAAKEEHLGDWPYAKIPSRGILLTEMFPIEKFIDLLDDAKEQESKYDITWEDLK